MKRANEEWGDLEFLYKACQTALTVEGAYSQTLA